MPLATAYTTGTATLTNGSAAVVGIGTSWVGAGLSAGDYILAAGYLVRIKTVNSNTSITLEVNWPQATRMNLAYEALYAGDGSKLSAAARDLIAAIAGGNLAAEAGLTGAADTVSYYTGAGAKALATFTAFGRSLVAALNASTALTTLGAAALASPALTGTPTAPTAAQAVNSTQIATTAYVRTAVSALVNASPAALDTLNELAAALGNDANYATTVTNALAGKQPLDATLTALAAQVTAANKLIYATGVDTFATADLTAVARTLLAATTAAAQRTALGLAFPISQKSAGFTVAVADRGTRFVYTASGGATAALPAIAGVADNDAYHFRVAGAGALTLDPDGTELIDGASTVILGKGQQATIVKEGTGWRFQGARPRMAMAIVDEQPSGTAGGGMTAATATKRTVTASGTPTIAGASVNGTNQILLPVGTYSIRGFAIGYKCGSHRLQLYNTTAAAIIAWGSTSVSPSGDGVSSESVLDEEFTLTVASTLELRHWAQTTQATNGQGLAATSGAVENYAKLTIEKLL